MEATGHCETSGNVYQDTRPSHPEESHLHVHKYVANLCLSFSVLESKVHLCTDTEALYRPYGPQGE
jgi:hypothetical protein